jgi:hypothetical protein
VVVRPPGRLARSGRGAIHCSSISSELADGLIEHGFSCAAPVTVSVRTSNPTKVVNLYRGRFFPFHCIAKGSTKTTVTNKIPFL